MPELADDLRTLLTYLRESRGFDFSGYKTSTLERRLRKRMEAVGVSGYDAYRDHLEVHPGEFEELFNTILINVTSFFRDTDAWNAVRDDVLPAMLAGKADDAPIRVWSAGCSSGQEAYSVAVLLAEALGTDAYLRRVKVYGTDVDDEALDEARQALYDTAALEAVPEDLRERYFEPTSAQRFCFRKDLRRSVIFGRNDLVQDAPISRIDLLLCRNTLMYFNSETQGQILRRLHFALQPTGFLFLGKSEMLLTRRATFEPVDLKRRIFTKVVRPGDRRALPPILPGRDDVVSDGALPPMAGRVLDASPTPQIVVGRDRTLLVVNEPARRTLRLGTPDVGRPLQDLEVSYRPAELRGALDGVFEEGRAAELGPVDYRLEEDDLAFEVRLEPLSTDGQVEAVSIAFLDVTSRRRAEEDAERSRRELGAAYEELQSTVEELETTNEELQSTNEELETTNEELQSTNEELETMNEELQSTNEELETMNDELRMRSLELHEGNIVMEAVLKEKGIGTVVVDRDERVHVWTSQSEDLWGLRSDEVVGERVLDLDFGLPVDELRPALRRALIADGEPTAIELPARDRRGREFTCAVTVLPLEHDGDRAPAAIMLTERRAG